MRRTMHALLSLIVATLAALATVPAAAATSNYPVSYNFPSSALLAGAQSDADPPGANDFSCQSSTRHPRPVVLVHGTAGNKNTNWQTYAPLLANEGYCVFALTYGVRAGTPPGPDHQFGGMDRMEASAAELRTLVTKVLRTSGADQVDLLGHSQGTLMPNYYLKFLEGAPKAHSYVSLAPLWQGTRLGTPEQLTKVAEGYSVSPEEIPGCAACPQMTTGPSFMKNMRAGGVAAPGVRYTNIVTQYDQLVVP